MTKRQRTLNTVRDWIGELPKSTAAMHHVDRAMTHYGVDLHATLEKMSYADLSVLLCLIVAQNAKACDDQRKWFSEHRSATRQPCEVIKLRVVK